MDEFDPRKNVLQGILGATQKRMAEGMKQKYSAPNLEATAKEPVPGAEGEPAEPTEDELAGLLEQMV